MRLFTVWDWVVFACMVLVSVGIGIFYAVRGMAASRRTSSGAQSSQSSTGEYLMGGRHMHLVPVSISILVSYISAILILGTPAEMYTAGTLYCLNLFGIIAAILLSALIFVPLIYPLQLTSSFEYLELRFDSKLAKLTGTCIMLVQQILYTGIASFAPATAVEIVTDIPTWITVLALIGIATIYTFLGGLKAVVWTDVFQSVVMITGLLTIIIMGASKVGGLGEVWSINEQWGRIDFWDSNPDPTVRHTSLSLIVGGTMLWLTAFGVAQPSVQRYCAVPTLNKARGAVLLNIPGILVLFTLASLAGIVMFAYYAQTGCDPLSSKEVGSANQLLPRFVMDVLNYPGLPGLFISCLFSGALSTVSSNLNAMSAVAWQDICKPLIGHKIRESSYIWVTRLLVILFGFAGIGIAYLAGSLGGTVLEISLSFNGAAAGPMMGLFLLGALFPFTNYIGAVAAGIVGLAVPMWIGMGSQGIKKGPYSLDFPDATCPAQNATAETVLGPEISGIDHLYTLSYLWYPSVGVLVVFIVGITVSLATNPFIEKKRVDSKYLLPIFDRLCCCIPEAIRKPCRCGYIFRSPTEICFLQSSEDLELKSTQINTVCDNTAFDNATFIPADEKRHI